MLADSSYDFKKKKKKNQKPCPPHTLSLRESTWLSKLNCQFLKKLSGSDGWLQRWADGWAGRFPQAAMAKYKETGLRPIFSSWERPRFLFPCLGTVYSLPSISPFLLPPPPHKHTCPGTGSKVADNLTLGLLGPRCVQFSCGRWQKKNDTAFSVCPCQHQTIHSPRTRRQSFADLIVRGL